MNATLAPAAVIREPRRRSEMVRLARRCLEAVASHLPGFEVRQAGGGLEVTTSHGRGFRITVTEHGIRYRDEACDEPWTDPIVVAAREPETAGEMDRLLGWAVQECAYATGLLFSPSGDEGSDYHLGVVGHFRIKVAEVDVD